MRGTAPGVRPRAVDDGPEIALKNIAELKMAAEQDAKVYTLLVHSKYRPLLRGRHRIEVMAQNELQLLNQMKLRLKIQAERWEGFGCKCLYWDPEFEEWVNFKQLKGEQRQPEGFTCPV